METLQAALASRYESGQDAPQAFSGRASVRYISQSHFCGELSDAHLFCWLSQSVAYRNMWFFQVNVLEEDSGLATKIILTNALPARASMAQAQNCYPEGARVTVRDPYLTRFPDGVVGVLVERPNDIAFLSRPESTGENGARIYGAVGLKGYDDGRVAHSREHGDFSRKIHMFEEQMKQESFHSPSHSHPVGHLKSLGHGHRDDVTSSRSSPAKEELKKRSSPLKEEPKEALVGESLAPQEIVGGTEDGPSSASGNVVLEEEPPSSAVEVPSVSPEEAVIAEVVVENKNLEIPEEHPALLPKDDEGVEPEVSSRELPVEEPSQEDASHGEVVLEQPVEEPSQGGASHDEVVLEQPVEEPSQEDASHGEVVLEQPVEEPSQGGASHDEVVLEQPVEEPSQEDASHDEVVLEQGRSGVEEATQPEESRVEVVDWAGDEEQQHSVEAEKIVEEVVNGKEEHTTPTEVSESTSEQHEEASVENGEPAHEEQPRTIESVAELPVPLIRKQFRRSDSLLAVHEHDHDSKPNAGEWAGESAISEKPSTLEREERKGSDVKDRVASQSVNPVNNEKFVEIHNANDLRVLGNLCFGEENYQGAADLYTRSLRLAEDEEKRQGKLVCSREIILGYSNRAEAYIRLNEFEKALLDAKKALSRDPTHLKSLFRKGRALLGLEKYELALSTLQVLYRLTSF